MSEDLLFIVLGFKIAVWSDAAPRYYYYFKVTPFGIQCCAHSFNTKYGEFLHEPSGKTLTCSETSVGKYVQKCSEKPTPLFHGFVPEGASLDILTCPVYHPGVPYEPVCRPDTKGGIACCVTKDQLKIVRPTATEKGRVFFPFLQDTDQTFVELDKCYFDKKQNHQNVLQCYQNKL